MLNSADSIRKHYCTIQIVDMGSNNTFELVTKIVFYNL